MMRRRISGALIALCGLCLTVALLLASVLFCVYDRPFYKAAYAELGVAQDIGMSEDDLLKATDALLDYCMGERADIGVEVTVDGVSRQAFNERETQHMADVKTLALASQTVRTVLLILFVALLAAGVLVGRRHIADIWLPLLFGLLAGIVLIAAVGAFAALDFETFWTRFHLLFFANDLWLLDPMTSLLINMVPEAFFFRLVMRILMLFGGAMALSFAACILGAVYNRRKRAKEAGHADIGD